MATRPWTACCMAYGVNTCWYLAGTKLVAEVAYTTQIPARTVQVVRSPNQSTILLGINSNRAVADALLRTASFTVTKRRRTTSSSSSNHQLRFRNMSAPKASVQVTGIDHIVLRVKDPVASVDWYASKLGLEPCRLEEFKHGKVPFPSVRITPTFLIDFMPLKFGTKVPENALADPAVEQTTSRHPNNVDHFCLTVHGDDIEAVNQQLAAVGVNAEQQFDGVVVRRFGAQGNADSIYVRDLDNNVVELRTYGRGQGGDFTSTTT